MTLLLKRAIDLHLKGSLDEAEDIYRSIPESAGNHVDALHMLGVLLCQKGRSGEGIPLLEKTVGLRPDAPAYHCNLANALHDAGLFEKALYHVMEALSLKTDYAEAHFIAGLCQADLGRIDAAMASYRQALLINPALASAQNNLGILLMDSGKLKEAALCFENAIQINPGYAQAHNNLGNLYKNMGKPTASIGCFERAIELTPGYADAYTNLAGAYKDLGRINDSLVCSRKALELDGTNPIYFSNYLLTLHYSDRISPEELFKEHRQCSSRFEQGHSWQRAFHPNVPDPERPLRIGYMSGDFRTHSVAYFIEPVLAAHSGRDFEIFCYSDVAVPDGTTARLIGLGGRWMTITHLKPREIAELIQKDGIDILVELSGHTNTKLLEVCAAKPAPIQITYLGYPDTTGLAAMDYRLTDLQADPTGISDAFNSETLLRLEPCFLCYNPLFDTPDPEGPPFKSKGSITFGSFNNRAKITSTTIDVWARILHAVKGSSIVLKATTLGDEQARNDILIQFSSMGIDPERVTIHSYLPSKQDHFSLYNEIDIALDTFPYNGTTTTCEALWMGVPVITLQGVPHVSRVGSSILKCLGLDDLIAQSHADYTNKAFRLAEDEERLSELRGTLRDRMLHSPIMDSPGFTRKLEACYRAAWKKWCSCREAPVMEISAGGEMTDYISKSSGIVSGLVSEGEELFHAGRLQEAEKVFLKALELDPLNVDVLNDLGVISWQYGQKEKATAYFRKVLSIEPDNCDAIANLEAFEGKPSPENT